MSQQEKYFGEDIFTETLALVRVKQKNDPASIKLIQVVYNPLSTGCLTFKRAKSSGVNQNKVIED